jgi:Cys-tRNA synthase (O-phospho-L-seryl-tRNA:Cys-tRNA synthase)
MPIGIDFIKEINKWNKNIQSVHFFREEYEQIDKIFTSKEPKDHKYLNFEDEKSEWDYWAFWKKKVFNNEIKIKKSFRIY